MIAHLVLFFALVFLGPIHSFEEKPASTITMIRLSNSSPRPSENPVTKEAGPPLPIETPKEKQAPEKQTPVKKTEKVSAPLKKEAQKTEPVKSKKTVNLNNKAKKAPSEKQPQKLKPDNAAIQAALNKVNSNIKERNTNTSSNGTSSSGGSHSGNIQSLAPEIAQYKSIVRSRVKRNLSYPGGNGSQVLRAVISFRISPSGSLISASFRSRSGNAGFDTAAMRAVQKASPFPPPPTGAVSQAFVVDLRRRQ